MTADEAFLFGALITGGAAVTSSRFRLTICLRIQWDVLGPRQAAFDNQQKEAAFVRLLVFALNNVRIQINHHLVQRRSIRTINDPHMAVRAGELFGHEPFDHSRNITCCSSGGTEKVKAQEQARGQGPFCRHVITLPA